MADDASRAADADSADATAAARGADTDIEAQMSTPATDDAPETPSNGGDAPARERDVVVPDAVYKRVTVFSTLIAVVSVVGGFIVLDVATDRATAALSEVDPLLALAGVGLIVFGGATYAFSTRFRADGMGNAKDETDEPSNNG